MSLRACRPGATHCRWRSMVFTLALGFQSEISGRKCGIQARGDGGAGVPCAASVSTRRIRSRAWSITLENAANRTWRCICSEPARVKLASLSPSMPSVCASRTPAFRCRCDGCGFLAGSNTTRGGARAVWGPYPGVSHGKSSTHGVDLRIWQAPLLASWRYARHLSLDGAPECA